MFYASLFITNLVLVQDIDDDLSKQLELPQLGSLHSKLDDLHFDSNNQIRRKLSNFHLYDYIHPSNSCQLISTFLLLNNRSLFAWTNYFREITWMTFPFQEDSAVRVSFPDFKKRPLPVCFAGQTMIVTADVMKNSLILRYFSHR